MILCNASRRVPVVPGAMAATLVVVITVACGSPQAPAQSAPAPAAQEASPTDAAPVVKPIEPAEGSSSGHISLFRWSAVDGADGYRIVVNAVTDQRIVWSSPVLPTPEAELPNTVALEPEGYYWQVTALKGADVLATSATSRFTVTP